MKKLLFIQLIALFCFSSVHAQEWFLGKSEKVIRDSLFKVGYNQFEGGMSPTKELSINFSYFNYNATDDTTLTKGPIDLPYNEYDFINDSCFSYLIIYKLEDYQKVKAYLDSKYKKVSDIKWVDSAGMMEAIIRKTNDDFFVRYEIIKQ